MSTPNDPFYLFGRGGTSSSPYKVYNEPLSVFEGRVLLTEVPHVKYHVVVKDGITVYGEVYDSGALTTDNNYFVDYDSGTVYFDNSHNGKQLTFTYTGEGYFNIPVRRVYTQSDNGVPTQNLQDMIDNYNQLNGTDLYTLFDPQTGHKHSGAAGDAPPIDSLYITYNDQNGTITNVNDRLFNHDGQLADIALNVKYFGAKGDGSTDDTTAIQNAIHSAHRIYFPQGTYLISSTLLVDNSYSTELFGSNATIITSSDFHMMRLKNAQHCIHDLIFDGTNRLDGIALIIEGSSQNSIIERNTFNHVAASGINIQQGADFTTVRNNHFESCGLGSNVVSPFNTTIYVADANNVRILNNELLNCAWGVYFRGTTEINNYLCDSNHITCHNSTISGLQGISNTLGTMARITNNLVSNFSDNAIDTNGCSYITINSNTIQTCKAGVFVGDNASKNITISSNNIRGCQCGVRVYNSDGNQNVLIENVVIDGNTIEANLNEGVILSCTGTGSLMSHIVVSSNTIDCLGSGVNGISINNVGQSSISNNKIYNVTNEGIICIKGEMLTIIGNTIQDVSTSKTNTYDMINMDLNTVRCIISDLICYGTGRYAINVAGSNNTIKTVRWRSMGTGGINNTGTSNVLSDYIAF